MVLRIVTRKGNGRTRAQPPYGYSFYKGKIIGDPREYPTPELIKSLGHKGSSVSEITRELNRQNILSRKKKRWDYGVVKAILNRPNLNDGLIEK